MGKVSIILPVYAPTPELQDLTTKFLKNLNYATLSDDYELIIIDSSRTSVLSEWTQLMADYYLWERQRSGFATAINMGIKLAHHEHIVTMSNDLTLPVGWLPTMLKVWDSTPRLGTLHPADTAHGIPIGVIEEGECFWPMTMTTATIWYELGGFDESLTQRYHDQDLSIRMAMHGYRVARTGDVLVGHQNNATYYQYPEADRKEWEDREGAIMLQRYGCSMYHQWYNRMVKQ